MSTSSLPSTAANPARAIKFIVIHCSASKNGEPLPLTELDRWHKLRGFKRDPKLIGYNSPALKHIGYHYVVGHHGVVDGARGEREIGAHVAGFNANSLGICVVGTDAFSAAQWEALKNLVQGLLKRYPRAEVRGHRDFSPDQNRNGVIEPFEWLKTCPGFEVADWVRNGMQPPRGHVLGVAP